MHIALFLLFILSALYMAWYAFDRGYHRGYVDGAMMRKASTSEGDYGE